MLRTDRPTTAIFLLACAVGTVSLMPAVGQSQGEIDRLWRDYEKRRELIDKDLAKKREAALGPVTRDFAAKMQRLADDATRAGKLTEALAAREAVARVMVPGKWEFESGPGGVSGDAEFLDSGRISGPPIFQAWTVENSQLVIHCGDGTVYKYPLPADWAAARSLKGTATKDQKTWDIRLLRR